MVRDNSYGTSYTNYFNDGYDEGNRYSFSWSLTTVEAAATGGSLFLKGDTEDHSYLDKDTYYESRGYPFKEQNLQQELGNWNQPPKGAWWIIGVSAAYSIYNNWVKPELNIPTPSVQPIYQQPNSQYDQYFMNLK